MWSGDKLILTPDLKFLPNSRKGDYENGFTCLYSSIGICVSISRQGNITWLIVRLNITPFNGRFFPCLFCFFFFSFRVLFEGINDFHVCLKESFPNLKVGFFFQFVSWLS